LRECVSHGPSHVRRVPAELLFSIPILARRVPKPAYDYRNVLRARKMVAVRHHLAGYARQSWRRRCYGNYAMVLHRKNPQMDEQPVGHGGISTEATHAKYRPTGSA